MNRLIRQLSSHKQFVTNKLWEGTPEKEFSWQIVVFNIFAHAAETNSLCIMWNILYPLNIYILLTAVMKTEALPCLLKEIRIMAKYKNCH